MHKPSTTAHVVDDYEALLLSGRGHVLHGACAKAKRVGTSTSHAETLCLQRQRDSSVGRRSLIAIQQQGRWVIPIGHAADCKDFFELATGQKGGPRTLGKMRYLLLIPTASMVADGLTKKFVGPPRQLLRLPTSGTFEFTNEGRAIELRQLPRRTDFNEQDWRISRNSQ